MAKAKRYGVTVNGKLERAYFSNPLDAKRWQAERRQVHERARAGLEDVIAPTPLKAHAAEFIRGRSENETFSHDEYRMRTYVLPNLPDDLIHKVKRSHWAVLFGPKGKLIKDYELSPATHNLIRALCHTMLESARREYDPPRTLQNPIADIDALKVTHGEVQILCSMEQIQAYLDAAPHDEVVPCYGAFAVVALNTGTRQGNMMGLHWEDIDFDRGMIHLRWKWSHAKNIFVPGAKGTTESRPLAMNQSMRNALLEWRQASKFARPGDFVFTTRHGRHLTDKVIYGAHGRTLKRASLPYIKPHALRHTYGTLFVAQGGNIYDLQKQLGHKSVTTTERFYLKDAPHLLKPRSEVVDLGATPAADVLPFRGKKSDS